MVPLIAVGRAPVRARSSHRACSIRESDGRTASRPADSSRSSTTQQRRTVPSRAAPSATVRLLRLVVYCIVSPDGGYRFGGGWRSRRRAPEHRDVRQGHVSGYRPRRTAGGLDADRRTASFERNHRSMGQLVGAGRREGLGADVVSDSVHDRGAVQVLTSRRVGVRTPGRPALASLRGRLVPPSFGQ